MTITPNLNLGDSSCIVLYAELVGPDGESCGTLAQIEGINIYGVGFSFDPAGVTFSSYSSFDADHNEELTGNGDYWEVFTISSEADSCCGGGFSFALDTYFSCTSDALFDWAETDVSVEYGLGSNFTVSTGLNVTDLGFTEWTIGFCVTW